jgi:endonuclease YncB( thermonuclease family)
MKSSPFGLVRHLLTLALVVILARTTTGQSIPKPALEPGPTCPVVRVVDGDAVVVTLDGRQTTISLIGLDTQRLWLRLAWRCPRTPGWSVRSARRWSGRPSEAIRSRK